MVDYDIGRCYNYKIERVCMKKIYFFGCSVTAGNELYEEAHIPNYTSMTFQEARKVLDRFSHDEIDAYQATHSFPYLTAQKLGVEFENLAISGISNVEIAARAFTHFPEERYSDIVVIMQFTTHNRMFVKYKEEKNTKTVGSFVVHPQIIDERLSKKQDNLLKETFFEFGDESVQSMHDHVYMYYAAETLRGKGIPTYILWPNRNIIKWGDWGHSDISKQTNFVNDKDPQFINNIGNHFVDRSVAFDILETPIHNIIPDNAYLPRYHYNQEAHNIIAVKLAEKLKCLNG